jgi:hypothetical protein
MTEVRIEHDDNAYTIIDKVNKLLEDEGYNARLLFDNKEHDGFDMLRVCNIHESGY